jgi:thiol-disulfide isomerase/thioredoxin
MANTQPFDSSILSTMKCNTNEIISELSQNQPVMLVFLRHFGCTFCREGLDEISKLRSEIEAAGTKIVFIHMTENKIAEKYFIEYHLPNATHISDPECEYYLAFGLVKGNFSQLFGFQNWAKAFNTGLVKGYGWANQIGDGFQMPGVFMVQEGEIKSSFVHKFASDQPNYAELSKCCEI